MLSRFESFMLDLFGHLQDWTVSALEEADTSGEADSPR